MTAGLDQWEEFCAAAKRLRPQMEKLLQTEISEGADFQTLLKETALEDPENNVEDFVLEQPLTPEKPQSRPSDKDKEETDECPNCHKFRCSEESCCACGKPGCSIRKQTCPFHVHGARVQHPDGSYGDHVPHMTQCAIDVTGKVVTVNSERYVPAEAPGIGNNCLIFSLAQCLKLENVDAKTVRMKLQDLHTKGQSQVTETNFLTAEYHWHSILRLLGADPTEYTLVVLNDSRQQGACHGCGKKQIVIENLGNYHFQPFLPI